MNQRIYDDKSRENFSLVTAKCQNPSEQQHNSVANYHPHQTKSNLERPWPILQILILLHLRASHSNTPISTTFNISIVLQEKRQSQHHPLQAKDQDSQPTRKLQNHSSIIFPHIGLQLTQKIPCSGINQHRNRALKYGSEHSGYHVGRVPSVGTNSSASGDSTGNGDDMEEDEEEAADGWDEAEGEGEEDAAGGCS
uniref:Uncharacterized protein n=1 Tax=Lotus japonicus TaxID=34305 RepID=I3T6H8_LOTJA|nr:unknown [Lotus japonicus]